MKQIMMYIAAILLLTACRQHGRYESDGETVFYSYWTFSFGQRYDTLQEADASTFKSVNSWLGHDAKRVYFKDKQVVGADPATIEAKDYPLCRDKNDYYYKTAPIHVADIKTFKILKKDYDDFWAKDSRRAYYDTLHIDGVDLPTFKVKSYAHAVDKNRVYRFGKKLPLADPRSYQEDWKGYYSCDNSHIWYMGDLLDDADYATFTVDDDCNAHDKFGVFEGKTRVY